MSFTFHIASVDAVMVYFGNTIDPLISKQVQQAYRALKEAKVGGIYEIIPSYASLMVVYDVLIFDDKTVCAKIESIIQNAQTKLIHEEKIVQIPTYYGCEVGFDLEALAQEKKLSVEEIVALHAKEIYSVYAIGFAPGFAYLGEIDEKLSTTRLSNPRKVVPKGSVAIADRQTAVYPMQSPGGWKILGRTPLAMFDAQYEGLSLLHVGDKVQFESISKEEFIALGGSL